MYKLRDDGYANFKKIMNGRKWAGRVSQTPGGFFAKIGTTKADGARREASGTSQRLEESSDGAKART